MEAGPIATALNPQQARHDDQRSACHGTQLHPNTHSLVVNNSLFYIFVCHVFRCSVLNMPRMGSFAELISVSNSVGIVCRPPLLSVWVCTLCGHDFVATLVSFCRACSLPQQASVLTHEGTDPALMGSYFSYRFKPLQPMAVFGRTATAEPPCPPSHAVWFAWKDPMFVVLHSNTKLSQMCCCLCIGIDSRSCSTFFDSHGVACVVYL